MRNTLYKIIRILRKLGQKIKNSYQILEQISDIFACRKLLFSPCKFDLFSLPKLVMD